MARPTSTTFSTSERSTPRGRQSSASNQTTASNTTTSGRCCHRVSRSPRRSTRTWVARSASSVIPAHSEPFQNANAPTASITPRTIQRIPRRRASMPKTRWMKVGRRNKVTSTEPVSAKVLVKASGRNSLPSAASRVNTGMKLTMVVETAVTMAGATSIAASWMVRRRSLTTPCSRRWRTTFSERMMPRSTMVPMAITMPESATMLASTWK